MTRADGEPIPSTAETLVYIFVSWYLITAVLTTLRIPPNPLFTLPAAMGVVYCSLAYDLPSRAEYQLGRLVGRWLADTGVDREE